MKPFHLLSLKNKWHMHDPNKFAVNMVAHQVKQKEGNSC